LAGYLRPVAEERPMNLLYQGTALEGYLPKLNQGTEAGKV